MTFVIVNYGENKTQLFNPNCKVRYLIDDIRKRCQCPEKMELELSDFSGNLKFISKTPDNFANSILNVDREDLVLLQVQRKNKYDPSKLLPPQAVGDEDDVTYVPLLKNEEIINQKFTARLQSREEAMNNRRSVSPVDSRGRKVDKNNKNKDNNNGSAPGSPVQSAKGSSRSAKGGSQKSSKTSKSRTKSRR